LITARGKKITWNANLTLRDVLKKIGYDIPAVIVAVNNEVVRKRDWDTFLVPNGARVDVHRMAAGG
jgi:thiamine biosynthesis protein ThiS